MKKVILIFMFCMLAVSGFAKEKKPVVKLPVKDIKIHVSQTRLNEVLRSMFVVLWDVGDVAAGYGGDSVVLNSDDSFEKTIIRR